MARSITIRLLIGLAMSGGAATLAGCSGGSDSVAVVAPPPPPPPAPLPMGAARFGAGFAMSFQAGTTTDPRDPMQADIIPASFTTDPLDVP